MMRNTYKTLIAALMAATVLAGCQNEDPIQKVEEGLPVSLSFSVEVPNMDDIVITRATDEQETNIEKMAILFYNAKQENSKPIIVEVNDLGTPTKKTTSTNWLYTINLDEEHLDGVYSGEWYMYPIANYDKYTNVDLTDLAGKTLKEFKEYTITASGRDITTSAVMMSGHYGTKESTNTITLKPGDNTFDDVFHLRRIVSKNIFKFVNGTGVTFTPQKYSIYNYSTSSTLLERDELNEYAGDNTFTNAENLPINSSDGTFSFYMPENVQAPKAKDSWTYADRERREAADYNTFTYAPVNATYVVVEGTYSGPGEGTNQATGNVKYTIHLGDFGNSSASTSSKFGNFSVIRNAKYTYTITVNGVNNIIAEAKTDTENQPGAEGQIVGPDPHVTVNLDAHYENVLLSFSSNITSFSVSATTPDASGNMQSFLDPNNNMDEHKDAVSWVKFGKPASTTTFANYPQNDDVVNIYELIKEINDRTQKHYLLGSDGKVYVQAFVDEYFYEDGRPYSSFVNADDRSLSFTVGTAAISSDGHSSYIEGEGFTLKQKSIKTFYNDKAGNPFGLESVEETPAAVLNSDTYAGTELQDGLKNTKEIISSSSLSKWTDFVNISSNGFNGDSAPTAATIMTDNGNNPLYQCLSRNRDLNGNEVIDDDEIRWYLPSFRQYIFTWCGKKSLPNEVNFDNPNYVSSTNQGYRIWWALEGTAISSWDQREYDPVVRCVRNLGTTSTGEVSSIADWDANSHIVTVSGLKDEALRTNDQSGEYPEHENTDAASTLPKAFKIAKENLNIPADGDSYFPEITVSQPTLSNSSASSYLTEVTVNANITLTGLDASRSQSYIIGNGTEVGFTNSSISLQIPVTFPDAYDANNNTANTNVIIKFDNGNYTTINFSVSVSVRDWGRRYYSYSVSTPTQTKTTVTTGTEARNTFKYTEIMTGDWCEKYYSEETGKSDLGKWRIPNEKELYFIQRYVGGEFDLSTQIIGAKTKYKRNSTTVPYMIYYLRLDDSAGTPIISTGDGQANADFSLRCVRDATPNSKSYDSSYGNGGTGFGL